MANFVGSLLRTFSIEVKNSFILTFPPVRSHNIPSKTPTSTSPNPDNNPPTRVCVSFVSLVAVLTEMPSISIFFTSTRPALTPILLEFTSFEMVEKNPTPICLFTSSGVSCTIVTLEMTGRALVEVRTLDCSSHNFIPCCAFAPRSFPEKFIGVQFCDCKFKSRKII